MDIIIKIYCITLISFNSFMLYKNGKKILKFHQEKNKRIKSNKDKIENQKQSLTQSFNVKVVKKRNIKTASFSKEENEKFENVLKKLKLENKNLYVFTQSLLDIMPKENLRNFMNNIENINIEYEPYKKALKNDGMLVTGFYNPVRNTIKIFTNEKQSSEAKKTLNHELLHLASTDSEYNAIGFSAKFLKAGLFGNGLNEGYTELLNQRIFQSKSKNKSENYLYLTFLAEEIENFYENKEDMLKHYFQADIFSLINELEKSMTTEEAIGLIADMDLFLNQDDVNLLYFLKLRQKIMNIYCRRYKKQTKKLVKKNNGKIT